MRALPRIDATLALVLFSANVNKRCLASDMVVLLIVAKVRTVLVPIKTIG